ncbi:MAG: hypothetical protein LUH07_00605, partial [Lachnospiraceae bacterium]|nr:hypothetical protein [Lachnospiraceae bacterium]
MERSIAEFLIKSIVSIDITLIWLYNVKIIITLNWMGERFFLPARRRQPGAIILSHHGASLGGICYADIRSNIFENNLSEGNVISCFPLTTHQRKTF